MSMGPLAIGLCLLAASPVPLVNVTALHRTGLHFDMLYATPHNFVGAQLYAAPRCLLRPQVARQLMAAQRYLRRRHPSLRLLVKDCYRPLRAQQRMFAKVRGTPHQPYVADPARPIGSVHTYGAAVDVTLCTSAGHELDLGTPVDALVPLAEPQREHAHLRAGALTPRQLQRRQMLRAAMLRGGGFRPIRHEWWHFDALQGKALRRQYRRLNVPVG